MKNETALESPVGRRKPGDEPRDGRRFTLPLSIIKALEDESRETGIPMARIVEQGLKLRIAHRLQKPDEP